MTTFERREECPPVEGFLWDNTAISFGNFEGVHKLTFAELLQLRSLVDHQLTDLKDEGR
jgi:hypothetical protein